MQYIGDLGTAAAFSIGALKHAERRRQMALPLSPFRAVAVPVGSSGRGEEWFDLGGGGPEFTFFPSGEGKARPGSIPKAEARLRLRWSVWGRSVSIRIDTPSEKIAIRLRTGNLPSLRAAVRYRDDGAGDHRRCLGMTAPSAYRFDEESAVDTDERDIFRELFDHGGLLDDCSRGAGLVPMRRLEALLLQLGRHARRRCDAAALRVARAFHPDARWFVYKLVATETNGRLAELASQCPGAFILAAGLQFYEDVPGLIDSFKRFAAGEVPLNVVLENLCRHWMAEERLNDPPPSADVLESLMAQVRESPVERSSNALRARLEAVEVRSSSGARKE